MTKKMANTKEEVKKKTKKEEYNHNHNDNYENVPISNSIVSR